MTIYYYYYILLYIYLPFFLKFFNFPAFYNTDSHITKRKILDVVKGKLVEIGEYEEFNAYIIIPYKTYSPIGEHFVPKLEN